MSSKTLPPSCISEDDRTSSDVEGTPVCQTEFCQLVHITGDGDRFYLLTADQSTELDKVVKLVESLREQYEDIVKGATPDNREETKLKQNEWQCKADEIGIIELKKGNESDNEHREDSNTDSLIHQQEDYKGRLEGLEAEKLWFERYHPIKNLDVNNLVARNWEDIKKTKILELDQEIAALETKIEHQTKEKKAKDSETNSRDTKVNDIYQVRSKHFNGTLDYNVDYIRGVREIKTLSDPSRLHYVPESYVINGLQDGESFLLGNNTREILGRNDRRVKDTGGELLNDISNAIREDMKKSRLGNIELNFIEWKTKDNFILNAWHREITADPKKYGPFTLNREAHFFRFAAAANAGVLDFDKNSGEFLLGAKGNASYSLAEGSMDFTATLPEENGHPLLICYTNSRKEPALLDFGSCRLKSKMELSCFLGGRVEGKAAYSGASALLASDIKVGRTPSGQVGLQGEGFAGIQVGGTLSGSLEWKASEAMTDSPSWGALVEVKKEGNLAFGGGFSGNIKIDYNNGVFEAYFKGQLVFGPGAGGGFGTTVDVSKAIEVVRFCTLAVRAADFRKVDSITQAAFIHFYRAIVFTLTRPHVTIHQALATTSDTLSTWWRSRQQLKEDAQVTITSVNKGVGDIHYSQLPPEAMGPILDTILKYRFRFYHGEWAYEQEKAVAILLSYITQWRHFLETLEHMHPRAEKVNSMESLDRINALLSFSEQRQLGQRIRQLRVEGEPLIYPELELPKDWKPVPLPSHMDSIGKVIQNISLAWTPSKQAIIDKDQLVTEQMLAVNNKYRKDHFRNIV